MRTEKKSEVKSVVVRLNVKSGESEDQTASLSGSIDCVPGLREIRCVLRAVQTAASLRQGLLITQHSQSKRTGRSFSVKETFLL